MKKELQELIDNPLLIFWKLNDRGLLKWMTDATYLRIAYKSKFGKSLNLTCPTTFNEKLQWLKLHDRNPNYTNLVDKYEAKKYVEGILGSEYIIQTLGVWNSFEEIDFNKLPERFVLKCTHDSGGLVICENKKLLDASAARTKINKCLKKNYYWHGREWPYKNVRPRIIAEEFLENGAAGLIDYKVHCFNGEPKLVLVCTDRFSPEGLHEDFFDIEWNHLDLKRPSHPNSKMNIKPPIKIDEMLRMARILSKGIPFARIDFYEIEGKVFFGEITLYPATGLELFEPLIYDNIMGEWLDIDVVNN